MKKALYSSGWLIISLLLVACTPKQSSENNTLADTTAVKSVQKFTGSYVSDSYNKRTEGYDWVAVTVSQASDSTVNISIRSRADLKKPTCTFDAKADIINDSIFRAKVEGKHILFTFSGNKVKISPETAEDESILYYFCSGGATMAGEYALIEGLPDQNQIDKRIYTKMLSLQNISFDIQTIKKENKYELTITPYGLKLDNSPITMLTDNRVINAEIEDLNSDGSPEVLVYLESIDGEITPLGYSVNNQKSMSQIAFPADNDTPQLFKNYNGEDSYSIVENTLSRQYPMFENGKATGKIKQINYKLTDGENMRKFVIKNSIEF